VPIEDCLAFLAALDDYPSWYPDVVRAVEVVEYGDGGIPLKAETKLHLAYGPVARDLDLLLAVKVLRPNLVELTHIPRGQSSGTSFNAAWRLEDHAGTRLALELDATMPVPGLVPLGGVGDAFAAGFMQAAVARLESSS
jgi:hypothetical protein